MASSESTSDIVLPAPPRPSASASAPATPADASRQRLHLAVWAPSARRLELCVGAERFPMHAKERGNWEIEVDAPRDGELLRYRYAIDGGQPVPDPFSRWQPDGVHGESAARHVAAGAVVPLARPTTLEDAIFYELHVGTFTAAGTYRAAIERLDHLVDLGITHVELLPVATFPGRHGWGYDGAFPFAPHPAYGSPDDLQALVSACHTRGLAVILDVVYNHFGPDGNYLPLYGPCFARRNKTLWGDTLNFDEPGNEGIRRLVLDNATLWLRDYGFDGLRLDAIHAIHDSSPKHILRELADHVRQLERALGRPLVLIAESDHNDPKVVRPADASGYGLDAFWADDFHHAVHRLFTGEDHGYYSDYDGFRDTVRAIRDGYVYQGQYSPSRQRNHGAPSRDLAPHQFVYCLQNHDQVGNRARGERFAQLVSPSRAKSAAALLLLAPGVPLLFQGEEWAASTPFLYFTDHVDPRLAQAVSEGRRREFPFTGTVPDPQLPGTFAASKLQWDELRAPAHREMHDWYRRLIALRRANATAPVSLAHDDCARWLTLTRGTVCGAFNFGTEPQRVPLPAGHWRLELASDPDDEAIPPGGVRLYRSRSSD